MTALTPGELQRRLQQRLRLGQLRGLHGDARQDALAQQHRQPVLCGQVFKGGATVQARRLGVAAQGVQGAEQALPVGHQALVSLRIGQRQKVPETLQARFGFIQSTTEQQGLGAQVNQTRTALQ
ncbi:hypothetical protein D3C87_1264850 [compost metagenome]